MRLLAPLRSREMTLLWGGLTLSAIGDQLYVVALSWIAVGVFGPAAGYLTALQAAVLLLAALGIGRWADRWDTAASLVGADLVRALALFALVATWLATGTVAAGPLVVAVVVLAAGQAVFQPALQLALPQVLADGAHLPAANALMDATDRSARLLGPGLIALLAGLLPTVHFLSLDAASFVVSAACVLLIRRRRPMPAVPTVAPGGAWAGLTRGVRAMDAHPVLGFVLRTTAVVNGAWFAGYFLVLPLLIERLGITGPGGSGLSAYGLVIAAYGVTNLLTTLLLGGLPVPARPQFRMFAGSFITAAGTALIGLAAALPQQWRLPAMAASAAAGAVGGPMKDILFAVLRQTRVGRADLGAGMRAYLAASSAGALLAMLATPTLLRLLGGTDVMLLCAGLFAATGAAGLAGTWSWREPAPPSERLR